MQEYEIKKLNIDLEYSNEKNTITAYAVAIKEISEEFAKDFRKELAIALHEVLSEKVKYKENVDRLNLINGPSFTLHNEISIGLDIKKCVRHIVETGVVMVKDNFKKPEEYK